MLRGRRGELERIDTLLDAARDGISGALVVRGEPGIGNTALLDHAAERACGLRVLRGSGIESEAELPFAGLHLLLHSALDRLDVLPGPQRRALSGAFGLGAGGGDRFLIGAGVLSLLAQLAEETPLLCLVMLGRHREAWISGAEAMSIARDTGQPLWSSYAAGALAYLAAVEGDEERCREYVDAAALDEGSPVSALSGSAWGQAAMALW
jgi:hypothetical protein